MASDSNWTEQMIQSHRMILVLLHVRLAFLPQPQMTLPAPLASAAQPAFDRLKRELKTESQLMTTTMMMMMRERMAFAGPPSFSDSLGLWLPKPTPNELEAFDDDCKGEPVAVKVLDGCPKVFTVSKELVWPAVGLGGLIGFVIAAPGPSPTLPAAGWNAACLLSLAAGALVAGAVVGMPNPKDDFGCCWSFNWSVLLAWSAALVFAPNPNDEEYGLFVLLLLFISGICFSGFPSYLLARLPFCFVYFVLPILPPKQLSFDWSVPVALVNPTFR